MRDIFVKKSDERSKSEKNANPSSSKNKYHEANQLVLKHQPLVYRIANHLMTRLPANVQRDDVTQAGFFGLMEASRKYDPEQGASFETYAGIRIKGAILDELRRMDWTPRSVHHYARKITEVTRQIENSKGCKATDMEVANEMDIDLHKLLKIKCDTSGCRIFSVEDMETIRKHVNSVDDECEQRVTLHPPELLTRHEFQHGIADMVNNLKERDRFIMVKYYHENITLKEIGAMLGVTESRVCQIRLEVLKKLRSRYRATAKSSGEIGPQYDDAA